MHQLKVAGMQRLKLEGMHRLKVEGMHPPKNIKLKSIKLIVPISNP